MLDLQRTVTELISLYELEPETRDIFVEGISDKLILDRFVKKNGLQDVKVIEVHEIDFKDMYEEFPNIKSNNRLKLIALSKKLEETFATKLTGLTIIIDRDFDEILGTSQTGEYLHYTDYTSLELYLFRPETIDIFYKNILHGFPLSGAETIDLLTPVLIDKFLVRLTLNIYGKISSEHFTPFKKTVIIDKIKLSIAFSPLIHIQKVANNAKKMPQLNDFKNHFEKIQCEHASCLEPKKLIRGHDFIDLFFNFIDKIKNNIGLTLDALERSLFQCIDYSKLKEEPLFAFLIGKYS